MHSHVLSTTPTSSSHGGNAPASRPAGDNGTHAALRWASEGRAVNFAQDNLKASGLGESDRLLDGCGRHHRH